MTNGSFGFGLWATVTPPSTWQFLAGSFNGQVAGDLFGYESTTGTLWVGGNSGASFDFAQWGTVDPAAGWQFNVGDFTGNGVADILGYHPSNGSLWVGENTGGQFTLSLWATVDPVDGWQFATGFFKGHAKRDVFGYHPSNGSLWVGENTGGGFTFEQWSTVDPADGWQFVADDFTGNGRTDVMGYHPSNGSVWVGENTGTEFNFSEWATVQPAAGWQFSSGHFTGRARTDLVGYDSSSGTLWVGENTGSNFAFQEWATVNPPMGWRFVADVFTDDRWTDVAGYHPDTGGIWLGEASVRPIEAYCWPLSAAPGETIDFFVSGEGPSHARFQRHTSTSDDVDSVTVMSLDFDAVGQTVPVLAGHTGCGWDSTFSVTVPNTWTSGFYSMTCTDADQNAFDVTFVVKPASANRSNVAVLANVNTWLAYNGWGGVSKYSGAARVSFHRPNPGAAPYGDYHLTRGELWIRGWLASAGYHPDLYSDIDFATDGCDAGQYKCLVVGTHPEYWSRQMYMNLSDYLDNGGSLLYLGGNGIYENGEYVLGGTAMDFRLGIEGGPRAPAMFRVLDPPVPERALLGVATERCGVAGTPYRINAANDPLFANVRVPKAGGGRRQVVNGDIFGQAGLNIGYGNGMASAWEVDTSSGIGATGIPPDCATEDLPVPAVTLPNGLVVLATADPDGGGLGAEMVYYEHPGGGIVFSAGSLTFGGSLVVDRTIQELIRNVLTRAGV